MRRVHDILTGSKLKRVLYDQHIRYLDFVRTSELPSCRLQLLTRNLDACPGHYRTPLIPHAPRTHAFAPGDRRQSSLTRNRCTSTWFASQSRGWSPPTILPGRVGCLDWGWIGRGVEG